MRRAGRIGLGTAIVAAVACAAPGLAGACTVPGTPDAGFDPPQDFAGTVTPAQQGDYLQIPFNVPAGTTAIRVRYCWDEPPDGTTLDVGVYEPAAAGAVPGPAERRGWSGSAVRDLAIAVNGFSPPAVYEADRKAYVRGYTTRAYQPGPIPPGRWTVELGIAAVAAPSVGYAVRVETTRTATGPTTRTRPCPRARLPPTRARAGTPATSTPTASRSPATPRSRPAWTTRSSRSRPAAPGSTSSASSTTTTTSAAASSAGTSPAIRASS